MDGALVLPPRGDVLRLDATGAWIWELIGVPVEVDEVVDSVASLCGAPRDEVATGARALLDTLNEAGATTETAP
jgi:hypothetical protein